MFKNTDSVIKSLLLETSKQTENEMLHQLGLLVSKGLLIWEETRPIMVREELNFDKYVFKIIKSGHFRLKDQEYIEQLEKEVEELKEFKKKTMELLDASKN